MAGGSGSRRRDCAMQRARRALVYAKRASGEERSWTCDADRTRRRPSTQRLVAAAAGGIAWQQRPQQLLCFFAEARRILRGPVTTLDRHLGAAARSLT